LSLLGVFFTISTFAEGEVAGGCVVTLIPLVCIGLGIWAYPGMTSPRAIALVEAREYREQLVQKEEEQRHSETPAYQLDKARRAKEALEKRHKEMGKTRADWQREFDELRSDLNRKLPATGVKSHQELVSRSDISQHTINLLNRAAHLRVLLAEIDGLLASADRTVLELDQQIWKLNKIIQLNNVTTHEESAAIQRALATATELVAERTSPAKREDIAAEEAKLFDEIMGRPR